MPFALSLHVSNGPCELILISDTRIFAPALLLVLAGIPLVPVPLIAKSMIHVASRPSVRSSCVLVSKVPLTIGQVVWSSCLITAIRPSQSLMNTIRYLLNGQRQSTRGAPRPSKFCNVICGRFPNSSEWIKVRAFKRIWRDIAGNYYGTTSSGLFVKFVFVSRSRA